jgi:hypothetical protein
VLSPVVTPIEPPASVTALPPTTLLPPTVVAFVAVAAFPVMFIPQVPLAPVPVFVGASLAIRNIVYAVVAAVVLLFEVAGVGKVGATLSAIVEP